MNKAHITLESSQQSPTTEGLQTIDISKQLYGRVSRQGLAGQLTAPDETLARWAALLDKKVESKGPDSYIELANATRWSVGRVALAEISLDEDNLHVHGIRYEACDLGDVSVLGLALLTADAEVITSPLLVITSGVYENPLGVRTADSPLLNPDLQPTGHWVDQVDTIMSSVA